MNIARARFFHRAPRARRLCLVVVALLSLLGISSALAHARYDHSTPSAGQLLAASPARVDIFTVQEMQKTQGSALIKVTDESGRQVDNGDTTIDDGDRKHFSVGLEPSLSNGRYVVSFNNVSDVDQEADHGQFAFYAGAGPTKVQQAADAKLEITAQVEKTSSSHTGLIVAIAVIVIAVLALAAGGLLWQRRRTRA